jgi:hypothetical protein
MYSSWTQQFYRVLCSTEGGSHTAELKHVTASDGHRLCDKLCEGRDHVAGALEPSASAYWQLSKSHL